MCFLTGHQCLVARTKKKKMTETLIHTVPTHSLHLVPLIGNQQQDVPVKDRGMFEMIHTEIHMRINPLHLSYLHKLTYTDINHNKCSNNSASFTLNQVLHKSCIHTCHLHPVDKLLRSMKWLCRGQWVKMNKGESE